MKKVAKKAVKKVAKKVAKKAVKKVAKKAVKKAVKFKSFGYWWDKVAKRKVSKMENDWIKTNEPNDPDEDSGGDHWHVNEMMHRGDAHEMTAEIAEEVWGAGATGKEWEMNMGNSLFCELDEVIMDAYQAGKDSRA